MPIDGRAGESPMVLFELCQERLTTTLPRARPSPT